MCHNPKTSVVLRPFRPCPDLASVSDPTGVQSCFEFFIVILRFALRIEGYWLWVDNTKRRGLAREAGDLGESCGLGVLLIWNIC